MHKFLEEKYGEKFIPSPWFEYEYEDGVALKKGYCNPDGIIVLDQGLVVVEIKLAHCLDAYYQLFMLYLPVISFHYGSGFKYRCIEITRWYDSEMHMPFPVRLTKEIEDSGIDALCVKIWKRPNAISNLSR